MKWLRKLRAKKFGVPFEDKDFWPAGIRFGSRRADQKILVWPDRTIYEPRLLFGQQELKVGNVVPVYLSLDFVHFYKILRIGRLGGSDHIVDPTYYHIEYAYSKRAEDCV